MKNFDLHMHSNYSKDGELTPKELIAIAKEKELEVIALSDHDCMLGIDEMIEEGKKEGSRVIPAIEFSTLFENGSDCHLLGYNFDYKQEYFQTIGAVLQKRMDEAFHVRVEKLRAMYLVHIDEEQVLKDAGNENPWFLMCERMFNDPAHADIEDFKDYRKGGKRSDPAPVNFFWDKCQKGSPLYVHVEMPSFKETVKKIHDAGGIAVLAHPFRTFYHNEELLEKAIECGIDGIEAYSNYHDEEMNRYYADYAKKHGLLITCGSDFHGKLKPSIEMGNYGSHVDGKEEILQNFLHAIDKER